MDRPVPPTHFKTQDPTVREDLRRIRVYLEQLNDWIAANDNPNALTAAAADLLYLKRSAGDFGTFPAQSAPSAASRLLIEDATNAFAKRYTTLAQATLQAWGAGRVPLFVPPGTPGTLDEEFASTSIPAGWVFRDTAAGVNRTPTTGTIVPHVSPTTNPVVNMHTNGRTSFMSIQLPSNTTFLVVKPFTYTGNQYYYANLGTFMAAGQSHGVSARFGLFADLAGVPSIANYVAVNQRDVAGVSNINCVVVVASAAVLNPVDPMNSGQPYDAAYIQNAGTAGSPLWDLGTMADSGDYQTIVRGDTHGVGTPGWIGWLLVPINSTTVTSTFHLDYVRESSRFPLIGKV